MSSRMTRAWVGCTAVALGLVTVGMFARAETLELALPEDAVDIRQSQMWRDGQPVADKIEQLLPVLGIGNVVPSNIGWNGGQVAKEGSASKFAYRVVFKRPVEAGTIFVAGTVREVSLLKPNAKLPGDPLDDQQWSRLDVAPRQGGGACYTLPEGTKVRALLLRETRENGRSSVNLLRLFKDRLQNATPAAFGYASQEYTPSNTKNTYGASRVVAGQGEWQSAGKDNTGFIPSPPITDINPAWFVMAWEQPRTISGIWIHDNFLKYELRTFIGADSVNPQTGTVKEWKKLTEYRDQAFRDQSFPGRWIQFAEPITTRGLQWHITRTTAGKVAQIDNVQVFAEPTDPAASPSASQISPKRIAFKVPPSAPGSANRQVTFVIDGPDGRRVRNLISREPMAAGEREVGWNLHDEHDGPVPAGTYRWKAISHEPFRLKYETTVYPNVKMVAPENSPWLNGQQDSGGWLADHTPPVGCCTVGDRVFLSAYVAESGVSFIECDLQGHKKWGHHSFAAWTGPRYLASDGQSAFVGSQILNTTTDAVWAVDLESKQVKPFLALTPTANRKRGLEGIAAKPGELALSIQAKENWLENAAAAEDVDSANSLPVYGAKRAPRAAYENVPDPQKDFLRLFRLVQHPSGGETPYTLTYLKSPRGRGSRQHIVMAFKQPVPLGSVVLPVPQTEEYRVQLSVLKSDAKYPPSPEKESQWQPFETQGTLPWDVVAAPENTMTRALRITFAKGTADDDDPLAKLIDGEKSDPLDTEKTPDTDKSESAEDAKKLAGLTDDQGAWNGQIEGLKLLRRRYVSPVAKAKVTVSSGKINELGEWDAQRDTPLTESDPAIYTLEWDEPVSLRGLAIKEIDGQFTKIDALDPEFNSAENEDAKKTEPKASWTELATYEQQRRDVGNGYGGLGLMNPLARYVDGYVDFGREVKTRSIRLRVVAQWKDNGQAACLGVRMDRGGRDLDAKRCRIYGVAPLAYIGGEPPIESAVKDRVEIYSTADAKLMKEVAVPQPKEIAYAPDGALWAISGRQVVRIETGLKATNSTSAGKITDLQAPTDLAFDKAGRLYVSDVAPERHHVRVYDPSGKLLRTIGTDGGFKVGKWDPKRIGDVTAICVDQDDQLWIVENQYWPKRVTVWSTAGVFKKELLGNTAYGGGGVLDPEDKSRLFYGSLEFEIDWKTGDSRLKNLTTLDGFNAGEVPMRVDGRQYLVTRPGFSERSVGLIYAYKTDHAVPVAAIGLAVDFDPVKKAETLAKLGSPDLTKKCFTWTDISGDGQVQPDEVTLFDRPAHVHGVSLFNRDLSAQQQSLRYTVKEFLPNGAPVYVVEDLLKKSQPSAATAAVQGSTQGDPGLASRTLYRLDNGSFFRLGDGAPITEAALKPDGTRTWEYFTEGTGVQALGNCGPYTTGQIVSEFGIVGHETAHAGELGEFVVIHSNHGAWSVWTADGLLVGPIFKDLRTGARSWSMPEHARGMWMDGITSGQEHFAGYFCRTKDNKYYVVAGHNHASVLEVVGIDTARRQSGEIVVTEEDVREADRWTQQQQRREVFARAPVIDCFRLKQSPVIDGKLEEWKTPAAKIEQDAEFHIGYDDQMLYLAYRVRNLGPLKNSGRELDRLFKTGAAVDLQIGLDPEADEGRQAPVEGDKRLLLTEAMLNGSSGKPQPVAVLFDALVPGTAKEDVVRIVSPVAEVQFDRIVRVEGVRMAAAALENGGYVLEAAVPLSALGLKPVANMRLKCDWGVLSTDQDGNVVLRRRYWSNQATGVVADAPSEARLTPHLWGHIRFHDERSSAEDQLKEFDDIAGKKGDKKKSDVNDLLDDLDAAPAKRKSK